MVEFSLGGVRCPHCNFHEFKFVGEPIMMKEGNKSQFFGVLLNLLLSPLGLFGTAASAALSPKLAKNIYHEGLEPLLYKCKSCRKKFLAEAEPAHEKEYLERRCEIILKRGAPLMESEASVKACPVFLNGMFVGMIERKQTIVIYTRVANNRLCIANQLGRVFKKGDIEIEAHSDKSVQLKFTGSRFKIKPVDTTTSGERRNK